MAVRQTASDNSGVAIVAGGGRGAGGGGGGGGRRAGGGAGGGLRAGGGACGGAGCGAGRCQRLAHVNGGGYGGGAGRKIARRGRDGEEEAPRSRRRHLQGRLESLALSDYPPTAEVNSEYKSESTSEYEHANDSMSSSSCCAATPPTLTLGLGLLRLLEPAANGWRTCFAA